LLVLLWGTSLLAQFDVGLVLPFENRTKDPQLDWIGESLAETMTTDLASARLWMIDRRERAGAFDALGLPTSLLSNATIYKVAETLDADQVIIGHYDYHDGVFTASAQVLDMAGPSLSRELAESGPLYSLLQLQGGLAWQIQKLLRPEYPFTREDYLADRPSPRLDAFENYLRGLIAKDKAQQIAFFRAAQRLDPQFTKPSFALGMIYFHDRDYQTTALWLSKLRRGDPDYLDANYFLGLSYLYLNQNERSAAAFRVVEQQLAMNEVYNNLGIVLTRLDRPGAIQYFEKAVASDPTDADYQFNLGYAYWKRGRYSEAAGHLHKALAMVDHPPVWRSLYDDCVQRARRMEAAAGPSSLPKAAGNSINSAIFQNLERPKDRYDGASLRQLRRLAQFQEELKHAELAFAEHTELHFQRAEQFLRDGDERQAIEEFQQVIDYDPDDPRPYRELAAIYLRAGRFEEASKMANRSLQRDASPEAYLLLARTYLSEGKLDDARAQLEIVASLEPGNTAAAEMLKDLAARSASSRP
jgi:tetratricopeptide (TPR) repeat protein